MKTLLPALALACTVAKAQVAAPKQDWVQLFNGKDLSNWTVKITGQETGVNFGNTFRVEDGLLKVRYDQYKEFNGQFGHIFHNQKFSHYVVAAEYRFVGDQCPGGAGWATRNSGIMIHGQSAASMGKDQDFPISIEVQLLGGLGRGPRPTANLCTPGTNVVRDGKLFTPHCLNSTSPTFDGDQWVRVEAEVHGSGVVKHFANGNLVLTYEQPQIGGGAVSKFNPEVKKDGMLLEEGSISLQSESHPVDFRKVELLNLVGCKDPKAKNYRDYFTREDKSLCRF